MNYVIDLVMMSKLSPDKARLIVRRVLPVSVVAVMAVWLFVWLQGTQEFSYFYREQQQIFLFDSTYIGELLMQVGGVGAVMAQFLTQFFVLPYMGAAISMLLTVATAVFFWLSLRKLNEDPVWMPLAFVPSVVYNVYLSDNYAHYEGLLALLVFSLLLWGYGVLSSKTSSILRHAVSTAVTVLLFFAFGSIAMLYSLAVLLYEALLRRPHWVWSFSPLAAVIVIGLIANNQAWVVSPAYAFGMKGYVEFFFEPDLFYAASWLSALVVVLLVWLLAKIRIQPLAGVCIAVLLLVALPLTANGISQKHLDTNMRDMQQVAYYANQDDWDSIIAFAQPRTGNYIFLNYLNLAYAKKGQLLDRLFTIPQQGANSLMMKYEQYTDISILMARLYYHIGVIGQSQYHAFSSNMSVTYGSPAMTKMMITNYIINGRYQIAEKSLRMLEKSWFYADWARGQRRFLYNDQAVESDLELGTKRKDLPDNDGFTMVYGPLNDIRNVIDANPEDPAAVEYAIGMMLLDKDFSSIRMFVESKYGLVKTWPECLQEAIVAYSEKDMDYCRRYGVSEEVIRRFAQFRQETLTLRHSGGSITPLASKWGKTFWYYMLKTTKR
ncbi:MAG: hypothetical protein HUJ99_04625 [Bacteroidaceae bacterium]|nr:hypothetical protein [Bacteroidaceae bacterium]